MKELKADCYGQLWVRHDLRSRLVVDYTTSYFPLIVLGYPLDCKEIWHIILTRSTLALKLSVSPPYYPWVTATPRVWNKPLAKVEMHDKITDILSDKGLVHLLEISTKGACVV